MSSSSSIEAFHSWERDESESALQTKSWHSDDPVNPTTPETPHDSLACFALLRPLYGVVREHGEVVRPEMIRSVSSLLLARNTEAVAREKERVKAYMSTRVR